MRSAEEVIDRVNRGSAEIGSVLDVIKSIAEQTTCCAECGYRGSTGR